MVLIGNYTCPPTSSAGVSIISTQTASINVRGNELRPIYHIYNISGINSDTTSKSASIFAIEIIPLNRDLCIVNRIV